MVSNKRNKIILVCTRILFFLSVIVMGAFSSGFFYSLNEKIFEYQNPAGFFIPSLADWGLAFALAVVFWSGTLFGLIGKKIDRILILFFILFGLWTYVYTDNITPQMYLGLVGVALLGNTIGYGLKLARLRWLKK